MNGGMETRRLQARQAEISQIKKDKRMMFFFSCLSVGLLLIIWQLVVVLKIVDTKFLDTPINVIKMIITKFTVKAPDGGLLMEHIAASLEVIVTGYLIAVIFAIPLGLFMGWFKLCDRFVRPLFEIIRPIPSIAWIPIIILFLGIGVEAKAVIIFFGCFIAILINTYTGIRLVNPVLVNVAKTCGAKNFTIFWKVGIPSAMPMIFAGMRIAIGAAWGTVVAAEMLASSKGLGFMIMMGRTYMTVELILSGILVIGVLGLLSSALFGLLEDSVLKWRPKR